MVCKKSNYFNAKVNGIFLLECVQVFCWVLEQKHGPKLVEINFTNVSKMPNS
jgi:hypothetical protein